MALNIKPLIALDHPEVTYPKEVMKFHTKQEESKADNSRKPTYIAKKRETKDNSILANALIRLNII
jgi:hypothetical protein